MMLRKKLRNNTMLMRTAVLEGLMLGRSVLYISMINNATMEENNVICEVIISGCDHEIDDARWLSPGKPSS